MKRLFRRWPRTCLLAAVALATGLLCALATALVYFKVSPLWVSGVAFAFLFWTCIAQDTAEAKRAAENEQEGNGSK